MRLVPSTPNIVEGFRKAPMKKYLFLFVLLVSGCTTSLGDNILSVQNSFQTIIFNDGVNLEEAKLIAQNALIENNVAEIYDLTNPQLENNVSDLPRHQDFWFISFNERKRGNIPFVFTALINKQTGRVQFADDYAKGKHWILEAALLKAR